MTTGAMQLKAAFGPSATMRYEEGGRFQVITVDGTEHRFPGFYHLDLIILEIKYERKKS